jgi:uncharacterized protein YbjT (DUF2867 family)
MNIKQVTVFGGSGFVGRAIVRALAPQGYLIRVACRRIELAEPLKTAGDVGQITLMRANLRMPDSVAVAVKGSDAVINAAGIPFQRGRQRYRAVHVEGARAIAEAARAAGVPILVDGPGPVFSIYMTDQSAVNDYRDFAACDRIGMAQLHAALLERGVNMVGRGLWFLSTAHTDEDIEQTTSAVADALTTIKQEATVA